MSMILGDSETPVGVSDLDTEYEIVGELGRGGMAVVYLARDRDLGRDVAVKLIRAQYVEDEEAIARFAHEARTVARLQHPSIVTIHAIKRLRDKSLALVMQYVPGGTLKEALRAGGPFSFERAESVLRDIAAALDYAHKHGVVHRDVKPENIFLDERTGRAMLSDFGVARRIDGGHSLTLTGIAIGTPTYMSPEQIDGNAIDGRSDLYSLALVGWEMLTGRRPWEGEGLYSVIFKQKNEQLPPLDDLRPDVPDRLQNVIERALEKDPDDRWDSAEELVAQLDDTSPAPFWRRLVRARRRRRRFVAALRPSSDQEELPETDPAQTLWFRRDEDGAVTPESAEAFDTPEPAPAPRRRRATLVAAAATLLLGATAGVAVIGRDWVAPRPSAPESYASPGQVEERAATQLAAPAPAVPAPELPSVESAMKAESIAADTSATAAALMEQPRSPDSVVARAVPVLPMPAAGVSTRPQDAGGDSVTSGRAAVESAPPTRARDERAARTIAAGTSPPLSADPPPTVAIPTPPMPSSPAASAAADVTTPAGALAGQRVSLVVGGMNSCVLTLGGAAYCWGGNDRGQLGDGSTTRRLAPSRVAGGLQFEAISAGVSHACGIARGGAAYCWGANDRGQLGDGSSVSRSSPVPVDGGFRFRVLRAGMTHTCGITQASEIYCWGDNLYGQLGDGGTVGHARPVRVQSAEQFAAVAVGWSHTCALTVAGVAFCWGHNTSGQLGDGSEEDRAVPTAVRGGGRWISIAAGSTHSCAVAEGGAASCWGSNSYGQLGDGSGAGHNTPTRVAGSVGFSGVTAGSVHSCALTRGGDVYCWGRNTYGQLGDGSNSDRSSPVRVQDGHAFSIVQARGAHTCGTTAGRESFCWGYNVAGQLGDGTQSHRSKPVRVALPGGS